MKTLSIEGHSDDTIGAYGLPPDHYTNASGLSALDDHDTCGSNNPPYQFDIVSESAGRARVTCVYNGCWSFAVGLVDEEDETPGFLASARFARADHSMSIELDVPDDTRVVWVGRD